MKKGRAKKDFALNKIFSFNFITSLNLNAKSKASSAVNPNIAVQFVENPKEKNVTAKNNGKILVLQPSLNMFLR